MEQSRVHLRPRRWHPTVGRHPGLGQAGLHEQRDAPVWQVQPDRRDGVVRESYVQPAANLMTCASERVIAFRSVGSPCYVHHHERCPLPPPAWSMSPPPPLPRYIFPYQPQLRYATGSERGFDGNPRCIRSPDGRCQPSINPQREWLTLFFLALFAEGMVPTGYVPGSHVVIRAGLMFSILQICVYNVRDVATAEKRNKEKSMSFALIPSSILLWSFSPSDSPWLPTLFPPDCAINRTSTFTFPGFSGPLHFGRWDVNFRY